MVNEIKDLNRNFSDVEIDLINQLIDKYNGVKTISDRGFIVVESETKNVSFKVNRDEKRRFIMVCVTEFGNYNPYLCLYPADIKRVLEL